MRGGVPHQSGLPGQSCRVTCLGGVSYLHVNAEGRELRLTGVIHLYDTSLFDSVN